MTQNHPHQHDGPSEGSGPDESNGPSEDNGPNEGAAFDEQETGNDEVAVDELSAVTAELAETKDRMLRALADTENTRRRAARDTEEARKYAVTGFARELLEVADNLGRALASVPDEVRESEQVKPLVEGIELTQKSLAACFERYKITRVEPAAGDKFDHNRHQAMFEVETEEQAPGTVVQVMQSGYVIADRLLRPAMVGVAKKPAVAASPAGNDDRPGQTLDTNA
ncbi:MAG: nucleotide exchange factor GrpE [Geminicoccaceae bacterium]